MGDTDGLGCGSHIMSSAQMPTLSVTRPKPTAAGRSPERERLIGRARKLSWLSLGWMLIEGTVATAAGVIAGSVALLGFGIDSAIEALASMIVIWRFSGRRLTSQTSERRAQQLVAVSFFLLAPYIAQDAIRGLINGDHPATSWAGIALSISSIAIMPLLGHAKLRIGQRLGSGATAGEGTQNLLCAYMAAGVLVGLLANTTLGAWWLDPAIALAIAALALHEGIETWQGHGCDCSTIPNLTDDAYRDDCCA
jgi:divalent metal cation (Fe/Co/Zn/Cd) transporter